MTNKCGVRGAVLRADKNHSVPCLNGHSKRPGVGSENLSPDQMLFGDPTTCENSALNEKQGQATNRAIYNVQKDKYGINDFTYERGTMMR